MAQQLYLHLEIDGTKIEGDSTTTSMGRADTIECSSFEYEVRGEYDLRARRPIVSHGDVIISKRIDRSTPLLLKALGNQEAVTLAEFRFFRPDVGGAGAEEQYYTVKLEGGHVTAIEQLSEDEIAGGQAAHTMPMMERITFDFRRITWTFEDGGVTHTEP